MFKEWDIYMIGVLTSKEELYDDGWREPIFINKYNSLQFNIKLISEEPDGFPNNKKFMAYTSDLEECGFEDEVSYSNEERIDRLKEFLKSRLLIFKPIKKGENYVVKDLKTIKKPDGFQNNSTYKATPLFKANSVEKNFGFFTDSIINKGFIGTIDGISKELADTPSIIIWQDEEEIKIIGNFISHIYGYGGFKFEYDFLKWCLFKEDWYQNIISSPEIDNILFIGNDVYTEMEESMNRGFDLKKEINVEDMDNNNNNDNSEIEFINTLIKKTKDLGLLYDEKDLVNFHTAIKSSNLVILSGMSGTGKSKLVQAYGEALGLDDSQLNFIPVRPSWADDGDLLGYVDSIHNIYKPADSGLINALVKAANNMDKIYIICLDEMNLARVEHYFSQFLSVLEMEGKSRKLKLYNNDLENKLYNSEQYPANLIIGENVLFVGTVNLDESTYHFSDKVLDRANVINLRSIKFSKIKEIKVEKKQKFKDEIMFSKYKSFKKVYNIVKLTDREIEFLEKMHYEINRVNKNIGIGFRIIKQIDDYLNNIPNSNILNRYEGFDIQFTQRILTKVRGPQEQWYDLIGEYNNKDGLLNSEFIRIMDKYTDISEFTISKEYIKNKAKELKIYGYTV